MHNLKQKGFTLIEIILVLGIVGVITVFAFNQLTYYADKVKTQHYVDQTKSYSKAFARMINDNYGDYYKHAQTNPTRPIVIRYSKLKAKGYIPAGMLDNNVFNQVPCVSVIYNQHSQQLQAIMFYGYDSRKPNLISLSQGRMSAQMFGGEVGYVQSNGKVAGVGKGWGLTTNSPYLSVANRCDLTTIPSNSLVVNLSMMPDLSNTLLDDKSIHKNTDNVSGKAPGESGNYNTMLTDLTMQAGVKVNGVFLAGNKADTGVFLGSGKSDAINAVRGNNLPSRKKYPGGNGDVILSNGDLVTKTFKPTQVKLQLDLCTDEEVGKEVIDGSRSNFMNEQLTCTKNGTYCGDFPNDNCYLPSKSVTVSYTPNTSTFDCQERLGQGYYIVVSSIRVGPGSARPGGDPNSGGGPGCNWDAPQRSEMHEIAGYSNGFPRAIKARTFWQAHSGVPFVSCNSGDWAAGWVTSIQCTNDTSTFARN